MDFRIECNLLSHGRIGVGVNVDVANALVMLDHGNPRTLRHGSNQVFSPARDAQVYIFSKGQQLRDGGPIRGGDYLNGVQRKFRIHGDRSIDHRPGDNLIRMDCFLPTSENRDVAGFKTEAGGIGRHVWARLVYDDNHPNGRGDFAEFEAVGAVALIQYPADWVRQFSDFP